MPAWLSGEITHLDVLLLDLLNRLKAEDTELFMDPVHALLVLLGETTLVANEGKIPLLEGLILGLGDEPPDKVVQGTVLAASRLAEFQPESSLRTCAMDDIP